MELLEALIRAEKAVRDAKLAAVGHDGVMCESTLARMQAEINDMIIQAKREVQ